MELIHSESFNLQEFTSVKSLNGVVLELQCFKGPKDYSWGINMFRGNDNEVLYNNVYLNVSLRHSLYNASVERPEWWILRDLGFVENKVDDAFRVNSKLHDEEF